MSHFSGGAFISGTNAEGGKLLLSGGTASGFIVSSGGHLRLSSDGTAVGAKVHAGASLSISSGGAALETKASGGRIIIATGGLASGTKLSAGSMLVAGTARDAVVSSGASLAVSNGGVLSSATVLGRMQVWKGARADSVCLSGGTLRIEYGLASGTILFGGSLALDHGTTLGTTVRGGIMLVRGGVASCTTVLSGVSMAVFSGGLASETTVSSGGRIVATGKVVDAKILGGGSLSMSGERASASGVTVSGGRMGLESGARAVKTTVSDGWQFVKVDGIASGTQVLEDGQQIVYAEGTAVKTTVSSGGLLTGKEGACLSCTTLKSGAEMTLASGNVLEGANAFTGAFVRGGTSSRPVRLANGASLSIGTKMDMSKMHLKTAGASLAISGAENRLASLTMDAKSTVSFDLSKLKAKGSTLMLSATTKNMQKTGRFSVTVVAQQQMGVYELSQNLVQAKNTAWSVCLGSNAVGTVKLNGGGFSKNGVSYRLTAAKNQICLVLKTKAGKMLKGTSKGETLSGTADSDVFYGGKGNDTFRNGNGRDCAVYGKAKWGQDRITKTAGTLVLVFKDLKAVDVTSSLSGSTMTIAKKADAKQKIVVEGWDSGRHSLVFGGAMKSFDAWAKSTSPTAAQTSAARTEVWKKAGLLAG